jgi:CRISPR-associated protein Csb1
MAQETKPRKLTLEDLKQSVKTAAAFRCRTTLQPAGGQGTKVFPPTYAGAVYAVEQRRLPGRDEPVNCVLLDSVQSQANRMEAALQDAVDGVLGDELKITIPVIEVDFSDFGPDSNAPDELRLIDGIGSVTSLQAPHRIADAILRDSMYQHNGELQPFRKSEIGRVIDRADARNATPLYELCPTALIFGVWDSTGPKGGLGAKFERAMTSEVMGINACFGIKTGSRIDPLGIEVNAGPIYEANDPNGIEWTTDPDAAKKDKKGNPLLFNRGGGAGKPGNPSKANHGNVTPSFSKYGKGAEGPDVMKRPELDVFYRINSLSGDLEQTNRISSTWPEARQKGIAPGGVTLEYAEQTTVLSLSALRRLRFPPGPKPMEPSKQRERDQAAQVVLTALAFCAAELSTADMDLRSRCLLWPNEPRCWQLLDRPDEQPKEFSLGAEAAVKLLKEAVKAAEEIGVIWHSDPLRLTPSEQLVKLVRKSQEQAAVVGAEEGGE